MLSDLQQDCVNVLSRRPLHIRALAHLLDRSYSGVRSALLVLLSKGLVSEYLLTSDSDPFFAPRRVFCLTDSGCASVTSSKWIDYVLSDDDDSKEFFTGLFLASLPSPLDLSQ